ncbi:MAG: hypothetical protein HY791_16565 [Deltaproteobacteria bacterium]|nr:hypothetical protein [Deltaproteobacteria bacterium]
MSLKGSSSLRSLALCLGVAFMTPFVVTTLAAPTAHAKPKKKKKKEKEPDKQTQPQIPETQPTAVETKDLEPRSKIPAPEYVPPAEKVATEVAKGQSKLSGGLRIRWSNAGAMQPVSAEVPVTVPLPDRAVPKPVGVETPGQRLVTSGDERISAHLSFFGSHAETVRQDAWDSDLYRGRATLGYERIGGSQLGAHLDLEYRARSSGARPTDRRIDALYVSWGMTDFVERDGPSFGVAVGRVLVPEAGQAQANGGALRLKLSDELRLGAFGGLNGNPYSYNWRLHKTEDFGTDWLTAGAFGSFRSGRILADLSGVFSMATVNVGKGGIDRVYAYGDFGWAIDEDLDAFVTAWFDVLPSRQPVQNLELSSTWTPTDSASLRLSVGRFSTLTFDSSSLWAFRIDPTSGKVVFVNNLGVTSSGVPVDEDQNPIQPYAQTFQLAIYNRAEVRAGVRFEELGVEPFASVDFLMRDTSQSLNVARGLRIEPSAGASYQNQDILDARLKVTAIIDPESRANLVGELGLSRELFGFQVGADVRYIAGDVPSADGGVSLAYVAPSWLMPGRLMVRGLFRYFRENVSIVRPIDKDILVAADVLPVVPLQESFYGGAGVDWKL